MWDNADYNFAFFRNKLHPHNVYFLEPLPTRAPREARPHCCYIGHVIFYVPEFPESLEIIDRLDSQWNLGGFFESYVKHGDEYFTVCGGTVRFFKGQWHKVWYCRRVHPEQEPRLKLVVGTVGNLAEKKRGMWWK